MKTENIVIWSIVALFAGALLTFVVINHNAKPYQERELFERNNSDDSSSLDITIFTDKATGCQYLWGSKAMTPRMSANGYQMGCKR